MLEVMSNSFQSLTKIENPEYLSITTAQWCLSVTAKRKKKVWKILRILGKKSTMEMVSIKYKLLNMNANSSILYAVIFSAKSIFAHLRVHESWCPGEQIQTSKSAV